MPDEEKLPRAEIREGRLYVGDEKEPYVQGAIRHLWLEVFGLKYHRHIEIDEGKTRCGSRISGTASIEDDKLAIAGSRRSPVQEIPFSVRAMLEEQEKYHWNVSIGFLPADWEIGTDDAWYFECYAPQSVFEELVSAYKTGQVQKLRVGSETNLWIRHYDWHTPVGADVTWYLVPSTERQSDMPEHATGKISQFSWEFVARPAVEGNKKPGPYELGRTFAEDMLRDAAREAETKESQAKEEQNWYKTAFFVACGILLLLLLFRH